MPALVAARFNPDFSAMYQTMTARGKPPKVDLADQDGYSSMTRLPWLKGFKLFDLYQS